MRDEDRKRQEAKARNIALRAELRTFVVVALREAEIPYAKLEHIVGASNQYITKVMHRDSEHDVPLTWFVAIARKCQELGKPEVGRALIDDIFAAVGLNLGTVIVPPHEPCELSKLAAVTRATKESAEFTVAYATALEDGHFDTAERAHLRREGHESINATRDALAQFGAA